MSVDAPVLLDLSRLIWRAWNPIPTGIDRVELAYAEYFLGEPARAARTIFVALNLAGRVGAIPSEEARLFLKRLSELWGGGDHAASPPHRRTVDRTLFKAVRMQSLGLRRRILLGGETRLLRMLRGQPGAPIYMLVSHHHLNRSDVIGRLKERFGVRFVCLVHDLIPIDFPEYVRPDHDRRHMNRMEAVLRHADGVIVNSSDTAASLRRFLAKLPEGLQRPIEIRTALLGTPPFPDLPAVQDVAPRPYFIFLGTLEPRKNHL
ncbi:MAG TPA: glycosyltransferase, partial [Stellaceae bacterium]|nr:glycosyltransferase [Stellaceae bacterium]